MLKMKNFRLSTAILVFILSCGNAFSQTSPVFNGSLVPVTGKKGMVVSQQYLATQAGLDVLKEGGNAIDAAVTTGFALAVTLPEAGNLGGGGFMLIHLAIKKEDIAIDYREKAPSLAKRDMFIDKKGTVDTAKAQYSYQAVGVPGTVAGFATAIEKYGTISLRRALKPAIKLAEEGFIVDEYLHETLVKAQKQLSASPASKAVFFKNGEPLKTGDRLIQKDLAASLKEIAEKGPDGFYKGEIAKKIASDMKANGGLITLKDLASYAAEMRTPVRGKYRGYEIVSMPPPSSGGVHLIQMLNLLEGYPQGLFGHNTTNTVSLMAECMKIAYADRSKYLGDPDFVKVPVAGLVSKEYSDELRKKINLDKPVPGKEILPGNPLKYESPNTTHFTVVDKFGNVVSNTFTLNFPYGTGLMATGTGILLNNEMDDFSAKPGSPNGFGLLGGSANAIEPGKRMLSSMTPTIVLKDGELYLATGTPGGSRIITTTLQVILNVIDHGMNVAEATNALRMHNQWLPDEIVVEKGFDQKTVDELNAKGYMVVFEDRLCCAQSIMKIKGILYGAADPRCAASKAMGF